MVSFSRQAVASPVHQDAAPKEFNRKEVVANPQLNALERASFVERNTAARSTESVGHASPDLKSVAERIAGDLPYNPGGEIGRGFQAKVIDRSTHVEKVPLTTTEQVWKKLMSKPQLVIALPRLIREVKEFAASMDEARRIVESRGVPGELIGNPVFHSDGRVIQEKMHPLSSVFANPKVTRDEKAFLIESFVDLVSIFAKHNVMERTFNFLANGALTPDGRLAYLDFGEITDRKEHAVSILTAKPWERSSRKLDPGLKSHYVAAMTEAAPALFDITGSWSVATNLSFKHDPGAAVATVNQKQSARRAGDDSVLPLAP